MERTINVKVNDFTLDNLRKIQEYYSSKLGVKVSQRDALAKLINETAMLIQNTGETFPGRTWENLVYDK